MKKRSLLLAVAMLVSSSAFAAAAPTNQTTASISVSVEVKAECVVDSDSLDMGSGSLLLAGAAGTASIAVACTNTVPYQIGLDAGDATGSTIQNRVLKGLNPANSISYNIYTDAQHQTVWGMTAGVDTVAGVGTGITTYAKANVYLAKQNVAPDTYSSNVTVFLTF